MTRILVISKYYPADISSGGHLRTHNLCKQLAARNECYLVCCGDLAPDTNPEAELGVCAHESLPAIPEHGRSQRRFLRLSNADFLQRSVPGYLAKVQKDVRHMCRKWNIDVIVCLTVGTAEIVTPLALPKILDFCDSTILTLRRMLANRGKSLTMLDRARFYVKRIRLQKMERAFLRAFDHTTTISEADRRCFLEVSGVSDNKVSVVPNGVANAALEAGSRAKERRRSVVFWGNLDFPPNWTAVEFFYKHVYLPFLAHEDIEWHIFGRGGSDTVELMAETEGIFVHGFVDRLFDEVSTHGVMVNPMVEGSGLKNKVLESFACRVPVVSTSLGIEAIDAQPELHYLEADTTEDFARSVVRLLFDGDLAASISERARGFVEDRFAWDTVGDELDAIIDRLCRKENEF